MSARPDLQLIVNRDTGESAERCEGCIAKEAANDRLTLSYEAKIRDLKNRLAEKMAEEAEADDTVLGVLNFWYDRALETRWWSRRPKFEPGDAEWKATRAPLNKHYTPPDLRRVIDGAFLEADEARRRGRTFRRHWLKPSFIFDSARIDTLFEAAFDPRFQRVRLARELPEVLRQRYWEVESSADPCACGHIRFDHHKPRPLEDVLDPPCAVPGCHCEAFEEALT